MVPCQPSGKFTESQSGVVRAQAQGQKTTKMQGVRKSNRHRKRPRRLGSPFTEEQQKKQLSPKKRLFNVQPEACA